MNISKFTSLISSALLSLSIITVAQQAQAGQLYNNWNYGIDSFTDGSVGDSFNIKGMAIKQTNDSIYVGLTGGTPLAGVPENGTLNNHVSYGDLFFNFTGQNFQNAQGNNKLFGVRFAQSNDTPVSLGVYKNVQAFSPTTSNNGYGSLRQYYDYGYNKPNTMGTDLPTAQSVYNYLYPSNVASNPTTSNTPILAEILSGNKIGNITLLSSTELSSLGLNFGHFNASGNQTFGFKFNRNLLPDGSFIGHLFLECGNDGVAIAANLTPVPESSTLGALALFGITLYGMKRRQNNV